MKYNLFANCILVKGASRNTIVDLQRRSLYFVSNDICKLLGNDKDTHIDYANCLDEQHRKKLDDDLTLLLEEEIIYEGDNDRFPNLDMSHHLDSTIDNAIIDFNEIDYTILSSILKQLEELNCRFIQIRLYKTIAISQFRKTIEILNLHSFNAIEVILQYECTMEQSIVNDLINNANNIFLCVISDSPFHSFTKGSGKIEGFNNIFFTKQKIKDQSSCGIISANNFVINIPTFTESQKHNTCLNGKISIDINGEIKNCPSMTKSYGNVKNIKLKEALAKRNFKDVWNIHKDQIKVCQDCEFRHICTDCRAYIEDVNDIYSKPAKCSYDPYTATWGQENSTHNPLHGQ